VWNTFVPVLGGVPPFTASTFTPERAITVTRLDARLELAPSACATNAVLTISDGTAGGTHSLTVTSADNDSGPLTLSYSAGVPIAFSLSTAAKGCKAYPAAANAVVEYKAQ
jgi:hypothetical protein